MSVVDEIINTIDDRIKNEIDFDLSRSNEDIENDIINLIDEELDSSLIYTDDCWDVAKELVGADNFSEYDMCDNIMELAFSALREETFKQLDIDEIIEKSQEPQYEENGGEEP